MTNEELHSKMEGIIEMMRGIDFSVKEPEYQKQIMKAVNDYTDTRVREALEKLLTSTFEVKIGNDFIGELGSITAVDAKDIKEVLATLTSPERNHE